MLMYQFFATIFHFENLSGTNLEEISNCLL